MTPTLPIIGGGNGAGKTTLARELFPRRGLMRFLNADKIARGGDDARGERTVISSLARIGLDRVRSGLEAGRVSQMPRLACCGSGGAVGETNPPDVTGEVLAESAIHVTFEAPPCPPVPPSPPSSGRLSPSDSGGRCRSFGNSSAISAPTSPFPTASPGRC